MLLAAGAAIVGFGVAQERFPGCTAALWNRGDVAFEIHGAAIEAQQIPGSNTVGGAHPRAVHVHPASMHRFGRERSGFEEAHGEEPPIDARNARTGLRHDMRRPALITERQGLKPLQ
jgi:hypothetical protein